MANILLTNDDGIHAPGLRALAGALAGLGTLTIVAPHQERSGAAQAITLRQPILCENVAEGEWAVEGTPTDAVIVALNKLLPEKPDLVLSGINRGANMGENVFYSGTVGAAMEAAINQIPAVALSLVSRRGDFRFEDAAAFGRRLAELVLAERLPAGVLLNVNIPQQWAGDVRFTRQSQKITRNVLKEGTDPRGRTYYWLHEQLVTDEMGQDSDYAAVHAGAVSITPIEVDRTHAVSLNHLSHWAQRLSRVG
jgi:5'-nucleotidase